MAACLLYHPAMERRVWMMLMVATAWGCAPRPAWLAVPAVSAGRAISLTGDTLWAAPVDPKDGPWLITQLQAARATASGNSEDLDSQLMLARRMAEVGQVREAVDLLSQTAWMHYLSPKVYRTRGELLLWLRELGPALHDLEIADFLSTRGGGLLRDGRTRNGSKSNFWAMLAEPAAGPDSAAVTSVQYQIAFHMGLIRYLQGNARDARVLLTEAVQRSSNDNDLAQAALWLFFTLRRAGDLAAATEILTAVDTAWAVTDHKPEHQLLLGFKGLVPTDTIQARALDRSGGPERSLYAYGIGFMLLVTDRRDEATLWLDQARSIPQWTELGYLAAEADLARLKRRDRGRG